MIKMQMDFKNDTKLIIIADPEHEEISILMLAEGINIDITKDWDEIRNLNSLLSHALEHYSTNFKRTPK